MKYIIVILSIISITLGYLLLSVDVPTDFKVGQCIQRKGDMDVALVFAKANSVYTVGIPSNGKWMVHPHNKPMIHEMERGWHLVDCPKLELTTIGD